jgi:cytochrome c oxidase subunit 4
MSTAVASHHDSIDIDHDSHHDLLYVKVAAILAIITAAEVSLPYIADVEGAVLVAMLVMMAVKFFMVGAYFMHLKDDANLLRRVFIGGLALAGVVYLAALAAFAWFSDSNGLNEGTPPPADAPPLFPEG